MGAAFKGRAGHAEAGIPRGPMWAFIVAQSEEAQDDGAFTDEEGAREWLATNHDAIMKETTRRLQKAQAASEKRRAAMAVILKAKQEEQKTAAKALKAAKLEAQRVAASPVP
jgi:tRNA nucleotidyltransferase (CCA-adding enzyme)